MVEQSDAEFVWSYERTEPLDTGNSTNQPTVSNDTGTSEDPHGTGVDGGRPDSGEERRARGTDIGCSGPAPSFRPLLGGR